MSVHRMSFRKPLLVALAAAGLAVPGLALAQTPMTGHSAYDTHVVFDNSETSDFYYRSHASVIAPSALEIKSGKVPVETTIFHTPPNALRLKWTSHEGGDWRISLDASREWVDFDYAGSDLTFWIYAEEPLTPDASPRILAHANGEETAAIHLIGDLAGIPAHQWVKVRLPFAKFTGLVGGTVDHHFDPAHLSDLMIYQGLDDGQPHTVYIDDVRVEDAVTATGTPPAAPADLTAKGYDRHVDLSWSQEPGVDHFTIYRSTDDKTFTPIGIQKGHWTRYEDFLGESGKTAQYKISAVDAAGQDSTLSAETRATTRTLSDDELMDMVQEANFRFYWDGAEPNSGMAVESLPGDEHQIAVGSSGFGIMALIVGVDRHFVTRQQGVERMLKIVRFLSRADRFHGVWPHYINGVTGHVMPVFGKYDDGGDLVETSFLMQGLLSARQYFTRDTPDEREIRDTITGFWRTVEYDWYRQRPDSDFLYWHWSPDYGFHINHPLIGWNETMIIYLEAIASPTHAVPPSMYYSGWAGQSATAVKYRQDWSRTTQGDHYANGNTYYGIKLDVGEGADDELFFTHFSFMGFDPRGKRDRYTDYFDNNRNQALIQQAYAVANPRHFADYGDNAWGQSAGAHTSGGRARPADDNGTITIAASLASMPYTPVESMKALKHFYRDLGGKTWGIYGFHDGYNATENWYDELYQGLNQAPSVVMIENYRTGLIWKLFMSNPEIAPALKAIGFTSDAAATPATHSKRKRK